MKYIKSIGIAFFLLFLSSAINGQTWGQETKDLLPSMREVTSFSTDSVIRRYGDGNSLHCMVRPRERGDIKLPDRYECVRIENGIVGNPEIVFDAIPNLKSEEGWWLKPAVAVAPDGSAIAVVPSNDFNGIVASVQKRRPDGTYAPWVRADQALETGRFVDFYVTATSSVDLIQVITLKTESATPGSPPIIRMYTPIIRSIEISYPNLTPVLSVTSLTDPSPQNVTAHTREVSEIQVINDVDRERVVNLINSRGQSSILVCPYLKPCHPGREGIPSNRTVYDAPVYWEYHTDLDKETGRIYVLVNQRQEGGDSAVTLITAFPHPTQPNEFRFEKSREVHYVGQDELRSGRSSRYARAVKALGKGIVAIAWNGPAGLCWQVYKPGLGWSTELSGIKSENLFGRTYTRWSSRTQEFVDFGLNPDGNPTVLAYGVRESLDRNAVVSQTYDLKSRQVAEVETLMELNPDYFPVFAFLNTKGAMLSHGYVPDRNNVTLNPNNQQVIIQKSWRR